MVVRLLALDAYTWSAKWGDAVAVGSRDDIARRIADQSFFEAVFIVLVQDKAFSRIFIFPEAKFVEKCAMLVDVEEVIL